MAGFIHTKTLMRYVSLLLVLTMTVPGPLWAKGDAKVSISEQKDQTAVLYRELGRTTYQEALPGLSDFLLGEDSGKAQLDLLNSSYYELGKKNATVAEVIAQYRKKTKNQEVSGAGSVILTCIAVWTAYGLVKDLIQHERCEKQEARDKVSRIIERSKSKTKAASSRTGLEPNGSPGDR